METKTNKVEELALDKFASMLIEKINSISNDWHKPWFTKGAARWATNLSGREYNGMNAFMLMMLCDEKGYDTPVFATFDRIADLNFVKDKQGKKVRCCNPDGTPKTYLKVNKGEESFPVFITLFSVRNKETGDKIEYDDYCKMSKAEKDGYKVYPYWKVYRVFNVCAQTNIAEACPELLAKLKGESKDASPAPACDGFSFAPLDDMIASGSWLCPIKPTYGDNAYYSISKDEIIIPLKEQFKSGESFYGNLLHEMAHSTGSESRLGRLKPTSFGSDEYSCEELVAEMTAALCSSRFGMEKHIKEDSVPYLKSWLKNLRKDPSFIKSVLLDVKRASQMITSALPVGCSASDAA